MRLTLASPGAENGGGQEKGRRSSEASRLFTEKWCQSGAKRGSKMEPKSGKITDGICMNFSTCLDAVFWWIFGCFGCQNRAQGGAKEEAEAMRKEKTRFA